MYRRPCRSSIQIPSARRTADRQGVETDWCKKTRASRRTRSRVGSSRWASTHARRRGDKFVSPSASAGVPPSMVPTPSVHPGGQLGEPPDDTRSWSSRGTGRSPAGWHRPPGSACGRPAAQPPRSPARPPSHSRRPPASARRNRPRGPRPPGHRDGGAGAPGWPPCTSCRGGPGRRTAPPGDSSSPGPTPQPWKNQRNSRRAWSGVAWPSSTLRSTRPGRIRRGRAARGDWSSGTAPGPRAS